MATKPLRGCVLLVLVSWLNISPLTSYVSKIQKKQLIESHNIIRARPPASNMREVVWDAAMENSSAQGVVLCPTKRNPGPLIGENLFHSSHRLDIEIAVGSWYEELNNYAYREDLCAPEKICGSYKQLVWAETEKFGCATHRCPATNNYLLLCNYFPKSVEEHQRPYLQGLRCSACPKNYKCKKKLCVSKFKADASSNFMKRPIRFILCVLLQIMFTAL